jgi:hypothetical protein
MARTLRTALLEPLHCGTWFPAHGPRIMGSLPLRALMTSAGRAALPGAARPLPRRVRGPGRPSHVYIPATGRIRHQTLWRRFADDRDLIAGKVLLLVTMGILTAVLEAVI